MKDLKSVYRAFNEETALKNLDILKEKWYSKYSVVIDSWYNNWSNLNTDVYKRQGLDYSEIAIIYPYNKKKLKSGKVMYFQYMLRKALEKANIPYIYAEENLTNISKKVGITISNIYTIKNLEYKACVICQLEMLYNHIINDTTQDYQINDFIGDLNKVYLATNRACDYLSIVTAFNEETSDIIKLLIESK